MSRYIYISTMIKKIIMALFVVLLFSIPASANATYDFNSCTIGTVPTGWTEDATNGSFKCVAGGVVNMLHVAGTAASSNNYNVPTAVTTDGLFSIQFNVTSNIAADYSYFVFNNVTPISTLSGVYLSIHTGNLYYYSGGWNVLQAIALSTNYTIKVNNTNLTAGKFDIYVDGVLKGNQINFAGASNSISYIHFSGAGGSDTDEYLDDVTIIDSNTTPTISYIPIIASDTLRYSNDSEVTTNSASLVKVKEIVITENYNGSWNITFESKCQTSTCSARIYKNSVAYGTLRSFSDTTYIKYSETFSSITVLAGDTIELWEARGLNVNPVYGRNFRILFDYDYANFTPTLQTPANGSLLNFTFPPQTDDVTFTWTNIGTSGYQFQVAEDAAFNLLEYDITTTTNTTTKAIDAGTHYWRVRTTNTGLDDGNWSETFSFLFTETTPSISGAAIQGVVYFLSDNTPTPLQGATVFLYNASFTQQKTTGSNGYFLFDNLENNSIYYVKASLKDYQTSEIITINVSGVMTYNIQLKPTEPTFFENDKQYVLFTARWMFCWSSCDIEGATMTVYKSGESTPVQIGAESNPKTTDTTGSASFLLFKTQLYRVTLVNSSAGISSEMTLYPKDTSYLWLIDQADEPFQDHDILERDAIITTVTKSVINSTATHINVTYNDTLAQTTNITVFLNQTNATMLNSSNSTGNMTASFIVSPYQGQSYLIHFFGYHSEYGTIDYTYSVLFEKTSVGISGIPDTLWLWFAVGIMFFTAAIFTASTVELGLIIVCAEGWIFLALGLFGSLGTTGLTRFGIALTLISVLAIFAYGRRQMTKEGYV